ncbi:MAG: radical SAM/SPASM domain-containing protein [Pseudomonadota bacterium]
MQAIYWVMSWACHRRCKHCYDDRFRPYVRDDLTRVINEGQAAWPRILANLPDDMSYVDTDGARKPTLIVLAGGEPLIDGFREDLFYPLLEGIAARWPNAPGTARPRVAIQTTGDIMTGDHVDQMLARGVTSIAIASIDDYHVGHQGEGKFRLMGKVRALMAARGVKEVSLGGEKLGRLKAPAPGKVKDGDPTFLFFGAQPDLWIGELWPRGRAWANGLSDATYETNFCARWSGGKNFLKYGQAGSEVAIEPDGSIYPCCLKTKAPLGSLAEERLTDILDDLADEPALQAIDKGDPEAMGLDTGWSRDDFRIAATQPDGKGRQVANVCLGCDAYFEKVLGDVLERRRAARMATSD